MYVCILLLLLLCSSDYTVQTHELKFSSKEFGQKEMPSALRNSKKKCLSALAEFACKDQGSTTCQNLNIISKESGLDDILERNPNMVLNNIIYSPIPEEDRWKVNMLDELLQVRSGLLELDGKMV